MDLELTDQTAVVIGGAQGLGHAIAATFARESARVVIIDRHPETTQIASRLKGPSGKSSLGIIADVTSYEAIKGAKLKIDDQFGHTDHLIFAAGIGSGKFGFPFWELEPEDWRRPLDVNLLGAVNVAHTFAPGMAESRAGSLLFIASVAGQMGSQTDPPYSASKAGLINFAQCAAKDLAPYGVRVNSLCPGMIKTALNQSVYQAWADRQTAEDVPDYETWAASKIRTLVPLGRWQTPENIADMAVFLASARASNITGQTINVDGGYVMHW